MDFQPQLSIRQPGIDPFAPGNLADMPDQTSIIVAENRVSTRYGRQRTDVFQRTTDAAKLMSQSFQLNPLGPSNALCQCVQPLPSLPQGCPGMAQTKTLFEGAQPIQSDINRLPHASQ